MSFENSKVLVVGGAGFVGSNLVKMLLNENKNIKVVVVDNLLSAEKENLPNDARLEFIQDTITSDKVLAKLDDSFDYVWHLSTFHGNQSSIHDPLKDHENNTLTTLKLMNHMKDYKNLKKMVYSDSIIKIFFKKESYTKADVESISSSDPTISITIEVVPT